MPKKANQEELPGLERRDVPEIEQAADRYRRIRDERSELSKQEAEAKAALIQVMKNKGRQFYSYNGLNVQLSNQENVKVKAKDEDSEEPVGTFTQPKRKRDAEEIAEGWIEQAEELIERQQAAETSEEERERLHKEAVANWRRERPASAGEDDETDYQDEWRAGLSLEEREKYDDAPCRCGHPRNFHDGAESEGQCTALNCGPTAPIPRCQGYHCPACDTKGGHQATCEHYVLGEGTPVQKPDDFTASRRRIDGGHASACSQSDTLTYDDYFRYSQAYDKDHHASHARKMDLKRDPKVDAKVRDWKRQQAGSSVEPEPKPKKRKKLPPVEAAIDR